MNNETLREMRQSINLSQAELAHWLGTTRRTVSRWETGSRPVPAAALHALRYRTRTETLMSSPYYIVCLSGFFANPGGVGLVIEEQRDGRLRLEKGSHFYKWLDNTQPVKVLGGTRPQGEANRAYVHYIIDCWLDGTDVVLGPQEL